MNPHLLALVQAARAKHAAAIAAKQATQTVESAPAIMQTSNIVTAVNTVLSETAKHAQSSKMEFIPEQLAAIVLGLHGKSC